MLILFILASCLLLMAGFYLLLIRSARVEECEGVVMTTEAVAPAEEEVERVLVVSGTAAR